VFFSDTGKGPDAFSASFVAEPVVAEQPVSMRAAAMSTLATASRDRRRGALERADVRLANEARRVMLSFGSGDPDA
jgi:hypothetical protein